MKADTVIPETDVATGQRHEPRAAPAVSVVVPVNERPEPLAELYEEYAAPIRALGIRYEFVFVSQPWCRGIVGPLAELKAAGEPVRVLEVAHTVGEAVLVKLGATRALGSVIVTLPSYRRVETDAIPRMIREIESGTEVATARRWPRRDSWINRLQTRMFHVLIGRLGGGRVHDLGCGVHAMRREVLEEIRLYGDFYRFLPLLAIRDGYRVKEIPAAQHPADRKTRIYGPGTYLRRLIDIIGVFFLLRFREKPLRFFGLLGSGLSLAGGAILVVLLAQRLAGQGIADRPLLLAGVLFVVLGVQAIALGLVGEIIVHLNAGQHSRYRVLGDGEPVSRATRSVKAP